MAFAEKADGQTIHHVVKGLLHAYDADTVEGIKLKVEDENPNATPEEINALCATLHSQIIDQATSPFNDPDLRNYIIDVEKNTNK